MTTPLPNIAQMSDVLQADFDRASDAFCLDFFGTIEQADEVGMNYVLVECDHPIVMTDTGFEHRFHFRMMTRTDYELESLEADVDGCTFANRPSAPKPF